MQSRLSFDSVLTMKLIIGRLDQVNILSHLNTNNQKIAWTEMRNHSSSFNSVFCPPLHSRFYSYEAYMDQHLLGKADKMSHRKQHEINWADTDRELKQSQKRRIELKHKSYVTMKICEKRRKFVWCRWYGIFHSTTRISIKLQNICICNILINYLKQDSVICTFYRTKCKRNIQTLNTSSFLWDAPDS